MRKKLIYTSISIVSMIIIWTCISFFVSNPVFFPHLHKIIIEMGKMLSEKTVWVVIFNTLLRLLIALILSIILGVLAALISFFYPSWYYIFKPYVTLLRSIPILSIILLILVILGSRLAPFVITFLMLFPIVFEGVYGGLQGIHQDYINIYKIYHNNKMIATKTFIPLIGQSIKTTLVQIVGLGVKVMIMAEYLSSTRKSIGEMILTDRINFNYVRVYAWTLWLVMIVLLVEFLLNRIKNTKIK